MKHIFIVNRTAGNGWGISSVLDQLKSVDGQYDCEVYYTEGKLDATNYIKHRCHEDTVTEMRFYACGGDGTLNEVANGVVGCENASMSCFACGSGNDFVKCVGGIEKYRNVKALLDAPEYPIDLIKANDKYCINVFSFGFDTAVVRVMEQVKNKKIIGGKNAYYTGIVKAFIGNMRTKCHVTVDGQAINGDDMLLCTAANGTHVGGGFNSSPRSKFNDGLIDVCLCKVITRLKFFQVIGLYKTGRHLDSKCAKNIIEYRQGKCIEITAEEGFAASLDGELVEGTRFKLEIVPECIRFAIPE